MQEDESLFLEIDNRQNKVELTEEIINLMKTCIKKTLEIEGVKIPISVSLVLVDNIQIHEMNLEFRGVDRETDVLSFPMLELNMENDNLSIEYFSNDIEPETNALMLGDIVISLEKAREQAVEYGHGFSREIAFLTVHSMLHLLGYDHMEHEEEIKMREKEEAVLTALGLTR